MLIYLILDIMFLMFHFLALALIIAAYVFLNNSNYDYMSEMANNWISGPVLSFNSNGTSCSRTDEILINDYWPGLIAGCKDSFGLIRKGKCPRKQAGLPILGAPQVQYKIWKGQYLCGTRGKEGYLDLSIAKNDQSCPSGQKSCGIIDSLNNVLCISTSSQCPVNYMSFVPANESYPHGLTVSSALNVTGGQIIGSVSITGNGRIISQFKLSEDIPCSNPYYINSPKSEPYPLELYYERNICKDPIGGEMYDVRYTKMDSYYQTKVLQENGILDYLLPAPDYVPNDTATISIYIRNYIGLAKECHDKIKSLGISSKLLEELSLLDDKIIDAKKLSFIGMVLNAIAAGWYMMFFIMLTIFLCRGDLTKHHKGNLIYGGMSALLCLAALILNGIHIGILYSLSDDYQIINESSCVDTITYAAISQNLNSISEAKKTSIASLLSNILLVLIYLFQLLLFFKKRE